MLAVIALHVVFIYAIQRMRSHRIDDVVHSDAPLVMVRVQLPRPPEPEPQRLREQEARVSEPQEPKRPEASSALEAAAPARPTPSPPRQIDWRANAARSAQIIAEGSVEPGPRSFGERKQPEPEGAAAPSVFGSEPKHKLGDVGEDGAGDPVVWMSDRCYTTLDKRVQTARDWIKANPGAFAPADINCLLFSVGSREPDGTLFEHIKKREEPPVPKAGTEMNPLPERVEDRN